MPGPRSSSQWLCAAAPGCGVAVGIPGALAAVVACATGCFDPDIDAGIACTEDGLCPGAFECNSERICVAPGGPDAAAPDAAAPDAETDDDGGLLPAGWESVLTGRAPGEPCPDALAAEAGGRVLKVGGASSSGTAVGVWRYAFGTWRELDLDADGPEPRTRHELAFGPAENLTVLFGGLGEAGNVLGDTWILLGEQWTQPPFPPELPAARLQHAMAGSRAGVLLFGGRSAESGALPLADTWELTTDGWTVASAESDAPSGRYAHAMAYDPNRDTVVLFGGLDGDGNTLGDTWEWQAGVWFERPVPAGADWPAPRANHGMAFDEHAGVIRLAAGLGPDGEVLGDTWEWDGSSWTRAAKDPSSPRGAAEMAPDRENGTVLLLDKACDTWRWRPAPL